MRRYTPVRHVRRLVAPAVGIDHVAVDLEGLQIVADLATDIQSGLVDQRGHGDWMQLSTVAAQGAVGLNNAAVDM